MQQDIYGRGDAVPSIEGLVPGEPVGEPPAAASSAAGARALPSVSGVPSEQLWRAAVLAAREAARAAAELRRSIEARRFEV